MMMVIENFKKNKIKPLKKKQENTGKQVEALKEETQKFLKELQKNTTKQVKEMNKTIQDLKMEIETIKNSQKETTLEIENLGKRSGVTDARITNRKKEIEERISGAEDIIENIDTTVKENAKMQKAPNPKHPGNPGHNEKSNRRIIDIEESEDSQLKGPVNIFNKIIEEIFPNIKKEMTINIQED
jgi:chromosome segregation ATPase